MAAFFIDNAPWTADDGNKSGRIPMTREENTTDPAQSLLVERAEALLHKEAVMVIATGSGAGPWTAPVYFVYSAGGLWFFSSPESRHIREGRHVAASIHHGAGDWREICGVQLTGRVREGGAAAVGAFARYLRKFPMVKEMAGAAMYDPVGFGERFGNRFYRLIPEMVLYTDNRFGLGFRKAVELEK